MNEINNLKDYPNTMTLFYSFIDKLVFSRIDLLNFFHTFNLYVKTYKERDKYRYTINGENIVIHGQCIYNYEEDAEFSALLKCFEIVEKIIIKTMMISK